MAVVKSGEFTEEGKPKYIPAPTPTSIAKKVSEQRVQKFRDGEKVSDTQLVKVMKDDEEVWVTPSEAQAISKEGSKQFIEAQQKQAEIERLTQEEIKKAGFDIEKIVSRQESQREKVAKLIIAEQKAKGTKAEEIFRQRRIEEQAKIGPLEREKAVLVQYVTAAGKGVIQVQVEPGKVREPIPKPEKEIEGPEIFLDPETARKVREQLAGKEIQKTVIRADFPDLRSYFPPKKRFSIIEAETFVPATGLITTETGLIRYFQRKKFEEAKGLLAKEEILLETPAKVGISLEKEGKILAGVSLIYIGRAAEVAYGISPPGIIRSIQQRGFAGTVEQFTGIPLIRAIKEGELLKATTPVGRLAELTGIGTGVYIGSRVTTATFKGVKKGIQVLQKESARLRMPEFTERAEASLKKIKLGAEPTGKGQQQFVKITESGQQIPQFGERFPEVVRVIISKKTGKVTRIIDPISGKVFKGEAIKDVQKTLDVITKEITITDKTFVARELGPIPGRKPIPKLKPEPSGKQIELGKVKEGFLDRELFDIEFEVPVTPPSKFFKFISGKKTEMPILVDTTGVIAITKTAIDFGRELKISAFDGEVLIKPGVPSMGGLILLPPLVEEEEKVKLKLEVDGRRFEREREEKFIIPSAFEKIQIKDLGQKLKQITIQKPKVGLAEELIREPTSENEREKKLILIPDIATELDTRLDHEFELKLDVPKPPPPKPPPKEIVLPPPLPERRFRESEEDDLFFVKAKSKGKFITLNKKALPRNKALNLGAEAVDNTASATFKLISAREKGKDVSDDLGFNLMDKFTKRNGTYIEKNKYRIDSMGEIQGITVKGWLAQRRKGLRI